MIRVAMTYRLCSPPRFETVSTRIHAATNIWRRTDIGTRVIVAIRLDRVEVGSATPELRRTLGHAEAEAEGWFNGSPYAVAESVFNEYDLEGCSLEPDAEV